MTSSHNDADGGLIDQIYEAAAIPEKWPSVIAGLCALSGSWGGALITVDAAKEMRWLATDAYDPVLRLASHQRMQERNVRPARSLARLHAGWLADLDVLTPEEHQRDPIYNELLRPHGIGWTAGSVVPLPTGEILVFDINRTLNAEPFDRRTLDRLDALRPHLARSALISLSMGLRSEQARVSTLAALGLAAASVDAKGRIVASNPLFDSLHDLFRIGASDRLTLRDPAANELFRFALANSTAPSVASVRSLPIRADGDRPAYIANVVPVRREANDLFRAATAVVTLTPVEAPEVPTRHLLHGLFDLTPAEARVAQTLMQGRTLEESAAHLSISPSTVRSHIKSIFAKTGTNRQSELVRLLLGTTPHLSPR